jgi:hypothetical protein
MSTKVKLFAQIPLDVLCRTDITPAAKLVYARLHLYSLKSGVAWPALDNLARDCGLSRKTTRTAIKQLGGEGLLNTEYRTDERGRTLSNCYQLQGGGKNSPLPKITPNIDIYTDGNSLRSLPDPEKEYLVAGVARTGSACGAAGQSGLGKKQSDSQAVGNEANQVSNFLTVPNQPEPSEPKARTVKAPLSHSAPPPPPNAHAPQGANGATPSRQRSGTGHKSNREAIGRGSRSFPERPIANFFADGTAKAAHNLFIRKIKKLLGTSQEVHFYHPAFDDEPLREIAKRLSTESQYHDFVERYVKAVGQAYSTMAERKKALATRYLFACLPKFWWDNKPHDIDPKGVEFIVDAIAAFEKYDPTSPALVALRHKKQEQSAPTPIVKPVPVAPKPPTESEFATIRSRDAADTAKRKREAALDAYLERVWERISSAMITEGCRFDGMTNAPREKSLAQVCLQLRRLPEPDALAVATEFGRWEAERRRQENASMTVFPFDISYTGHNFTKFLETRPDIAARLAPVTRAAA